MKEKISLDLKAQTVKDEICYFRNYFDDAAWNSLFLQCV